MRSSAQQVLLSAFGAASHTFLQPSADLHAASLALAKSYIDPLALEVSQLQHDRWQESRKKRKRAQDDGSGKDVLRLKNLHVDGFSIDQVWAQVKRVLDAATTETEGHLVAHQQSEKENPLHLTQRTAKDQDRSVEIVHFDEEGFELSGSDGEGDNEQLGGVTDTEDLSLEDEQDGDAISDVVMDDGDSEGVASEKEILEADNEKLSEGDDAASETFVTDPDGLNDGFFSINEFNKRSAFLEQQDTRGDPDPDAASDEEEIDWNADPMDASQQQYAAEDGGSENDMSEKESSTFDDGELDDVDGFDQDVLDSQLQANNLDAPDANQIHYRDFFAPPARNDGPAAKRRKKQVTFQEEPRTEHERTEDEIQRTMSAVHRDLFEDDDPADEGDNLTKEETAGRTARLSTHERRQAKLTEQIRRLEAANVAKREWTLSGEVRAVERPVNSLLEQDLDFERTGKPVPVITAEVSESIEDLIKRRILAKEFDEVRRRRPDNLVIPGAVRRGLGQYELDDGRSREGLAEQYEQEHLKKTDQNYVDARDEKLKKEHREIENLWKDVSARLDALCSWHYKPRPPAANIEVRSDVPAISMEDARPSAGGDMAGSGSLLAPQEFYKPGDEAKERGTNGELLTKGGIPVGREEMTRDERVRRRRREKERMRKAGTPIADGKNKESKSAREKRGVLDDLRKGDVKVIAAKGEIKDIEGRTIHERNETTSGGTYKL